MIRHLIGLFVLVFSIGASNAQEKSWSDGRNLNADNLTNQLDSFTTNNSNQSEYTADNPVEDKDQKISSLSNKENYYNKLIVHEATKGIKVDVFGPFRGYSQISYENVIEEGKGYELSLGIIGLGRNQSFEYSDTVINSSQDRKGQFGFFLSAGYKFNKLPIFETAGEKHTHIMQGFYAKPIIYIGQYYENRIAQIAYKKFELERPSTTFAAMQVEFGKQWVIENKGLLDMYIGVGYGVDNKKYYSTSYYNYTTTSAFNYCNDRIGRSPGISVTMGIKIGILTK